jgi:hypothetical protein
VSVLASDTRLLENGTVTLKASAGVS